MSSSKTLILGSAVVVLGVAAFMATRHASPDALDQVSTAQQRSHPRRLPEFSTTVLGHRLRSTDNSLPGDLRRDFDLQAKGYNAARAGMEVMLAGLGELTGKRERESFLRGAFTFAANLDVPDALKWALQAPLGEARDTALLTLYGKWSDQTTAEVLGEDSPAGGGIAGALGTFLLRTHRATPEEVATFAYDFVLGSRRVSLIADAAAELAATDPAKAFALGDALHGDAVFLKRFSAGWAAHDPLAAWQWAGQIPDPEARREMQAIAVAALGTSDPHAAARDLQRMNLQGEFRTEAIEALGANWAAKDAKAALRWADTFPDAADRASAKKGIGVSAPVGIGVALSESSNNDFVVNYVMPGSPASRAGGLALGDRIVAVKDASGNWLNSGDLKLTEFIAHIRGEPNTSALLQIQGKDGGIPRTVTIIREQLLPPKEP